jgi:hypothetical protein
MLYKFSSLYDTDLFHFSFPSSSLQLPSAQIITIYLYVRSQQKKILVSIKCHRELTITETQFLNVFRFFLCITLVFSLSSFMFVAFLFLYLSHTLSPHYSLPFELVCHCSLSRASDVGSYCLHDTWARWQANSSLAQR